MEEDLKKMRCERLLAPPWNFKNEEMMRELITTQPNMFDKTVYDQLEE